VCRVCYQLEIGMGSLQNSTGGRGKVGAGLGLGRAKGVLTS
jgi:hypothetical protein